jgi:hypothetical protein
MRNSLVGPSLAAVALVAVSVLILARTAPRSTATTGEGASPTPDLSGVWMQGTLGDSLGQDVPQLQPWAAERAKANLAAGPDGDPEEKCFPAGVPRIYLHRYPFEILQVSGRMIMFFEYDHFVRQIWIDGRDHPKAEELDPTWMGHSIGRWEGETLVVDTVGFNDRTWLDNTGIPHSEGLHLVERFSRVDPETLQIDFTAEDPKAFTRPWTGRKVFRLRPGWEISEQICADNFLWTEPGH